MSQMAKRFKRGEIPSEEEENILDALVGSLIEWIHKIAVKKNKMILGGWLSLESQGGKNDNLPYRKEALDFP